MSWSHRQSRALGPPPVVLINRKGGKRRASLVLDAEFRNNILGEPGSGLGQPRTRRTPAGLAWRSDSDSQHMTRRLRIPHTELFNNRQLLLKTRSGAKQALTRFNTAIRPDYRKIFPIF